jgi:dienelactone hydrolase
MKKRSALVSMLATVALLSWIAVSRQQPAVAAGQPPGATVAPAHATASRTWSTKPADMTFLPTDFYSEGVRLQGQTIYATANQGRRLPTVISATGWGGVANSFRNVAVELARAGYAVFLFDYRGWGGSDGRVILTAASTTGDSATSFTASVQELRNYINPWEQVEDWFNAISFVAAQSWADANRIGIRGASFSGGHVIYVAAHEPRVKAVVSLIGAFDGHPERWVVDAAVPAQVIADRNERAARLAAGDRAAFPAWCPATRSRAGTQPIRRTR